MFSKGFFPTVVKSQDCEVKIFRPVQIQSICRQQNKCDLKSEILFGIGRKRRKYCLPAISPFLTMVSTLYDTHFPLQMLFQMSPAICFNLVHSKILSSGNGLRQFAKQYPV